MQFLQAVVDIGHELGLVRSTSFWLYYVDYKYLSLEPFMIVGLGFN